ncbi:uncharacterized protein N7483_005075 [Penicillium malachiteum]|uniref:uncharacterized protein n=1 Tax=Penicillium malachiteum TaxID=1324776 RepID=UPI002547B49D|nr:uncharacterized protein N7483_005075 [Penicillium malachiteum]KAJ5730567.1 hypothetical protein N7483_005075 [Penicillium malachiteum]
MSDRARQLGLTEWGNPVTTTWTSDFAWALLQARAHRNVNWRVRRRAHARSNPRWSNPNRPGYAAYAQQAGTDAPPGQECTRCARGRAAFGTCAVLVFDGDIAYNGSCIACGYGDVANQCSHRSQLPQYVYDLVAAENPDHPILQLPANAALARTTAQPANQTVMEYDAPGSDPFVDHSEAFVDQAELESLLLSSDSSSLSSLGATPNSAADSESSQRTAQQPLLVISDDSSSLSTISTPTPNSGGEEEPTEFYFGPWGSF